MSENKEGIKRTLKDFAANSDHGKSEPLTAKRIKDIFESVPEWKEAIAAASKLSNDPSEDHFLKNAVADIGGHDGSIRYPMGNEGLKLVKELQFSGLFRGILSGEDIKKVCLNTDKPMLTPYVSPYRWKGVSGGPDENGYSIRLGNKWSRISSEFIDTADIKGTLKYEQFEADYYDLEPGQSILAVSQEKFDLPEWVIGLSWFKSTLARLGLLVVITPIESGWNGHLTIEITNNNGKYKHGNKSHSGAKIRLYNGLPITQIVFHAVLPSRYSGVYNGQKFVPVNALDNKQEE